VIEFGKSVFDMSIKTAVEQTDPLQESVGGLCWFLRRESFGVVVNGKKLTVASRGSRWSRSVASCAVLFAIVLLFSVWAATGLSPSFSHYSLVICRAES
jgi:hypothetical protein